MNPTPLVSVVIPFRNAEGTLIRAIQSILDQTFTDFELFLVNNSSTDTSPQLAESLASKDSRIKLLFEQKLGVVHAANRGLSMASGKFIARMDADDFSMADRLQDQIDFLQRNPKIGVVSCGIKYVGNDTNVGLKKYVNWVNSITSTEEIELSQFIEYPLVNPSLMMRRSIYSQFGGYKEGKFPEDYEYFLRLQEEGIKMGKVEKVLLEWHDSDNRLTRSSNNYSVSNFFRIKSTFLSKWLSKNNPYHPHVTIWGAGKKSKKLSSYLLHYGIQIDHYIDVDEKKTGSVHYRSYDFHTESFILSYVGTRGARDEIKRFLIDKGLAEGKHFLICA